MLSPRIHGLDHYRSLNRFTARHDWREICVGHVFRVRQYPGKGRRDHWLTFETLAILPRNRAQDCHQARILVRNLNSGRIFTERLEKVWLGWDHGNLDGYRVDWEPAWVKKSIERHARKVARERARIRRFLVVAGLVKDGGAA